MTDKFKQELIKGSINQMSASFNKMMFYCALQRYDLLEHIIKEMRIDICELEKIIIQETNNDK